MLRSITCIAYNCEEDSLLSGEDELLGVRKKDIEGKTFSFTTLAKLVCLVVLEGRGVAGEGEAASFAGAGPSLGVGEWSPL